MPRKRDENRIELVYGTLDMHRRDHRYFFGS